MVSVVLRISTMAPVLVCTKALLPACLPTCGLGVMARPRSILTGFKLVHSFQVEPNSYTELILDFDAMNSII